MSDDNFNYDDYEEIPSDDELKTVAALSEQQIALEKEISTITQKLLSKLKEYKNISEKQLPEAVATAGLNSFELANGRKITIKSDYFAGKLTDIKDKEGIEWLKENGGNDLLRITLTVDFPEGAIEQAKNLLELVRNHPSSNSFLKLEMERHVNAASLSSFIRDLTKRGIEPPLLILRGYKRVKAIISGSKLKTVKIDSAFLKQED